MGIGDSFRDAYYSLEDKWYSFIDGVSGKIPAIGGFVDALEDKSIPSFPAFILLIILIIAVLAFFFLSSTQATLTIKVTDDSGSVIEGASVIVLQNDNQIANVTTKENGLAVFSLPKGDYDLKIDKESYPTSTRAISLNGDSEEDFTLSIEDTTITKAIYLKTANGELISGSGTVIYKCRGDTTDATATYASGKFDAIVKKTCTAVEVITIQNYNLIEPIASFAGNSAVTVERVEVIIGRATVTLSIASATELPPAGIRVQLVPNDNTTPISAITQGTAVIIFEEVPIKSYYVLITDPNGAFAVYDGSKLNETKNVLRGETTAFTAALTRTQATKITINVKDSATGLPIRGAEVKLTSTTNTNDILTKITGSTGQAEFSVSLGTNYIVTSEHPEYVSGKTVPAVAGETLNFQMEKVDSTNSNTLTVQVVDSKDKPIDYARVVLKKIEASEPIVGEKVTGASGEAQFFNLEVGKSYIASISKEGFGSQTSPSVQIEPKSNKTVKVTFDIGYGKVLVKVLDPEKTPLPGISVKAFNFITAKQEGSSILTGADGIAEFSEIRADKKIFFVIESAAYSKYFTATVQPSANVTMNKEIVLMRPTAKLLAEPVIIYSGTEEMQNGSNTEVGVSQGIYTLKAILQVPKGSFSEAGMHIRTGKQTQNLTNNFEEDGLYISTVDASGRITKGTTYTPLVGYDVDSKNTTQGNAKWANIVWKNPAEGTYEVEAEISVTETNPGVPLELFYRGWTKGSATLRDPASSVSGNELYSIAKRKILSVGSSSMCTASFCKSYTLIPLTGSEAGRSRMVSGTIEAKKGVTYSLTADLTNYSGKTITGAALNVEGKSVDINSIIVNDLPQILNGAISLGNIGADAPVKIVVTFTTKASGSSGIKFTINSSTKNEFDELIAINVKANKKFLLSIVPKIIVPYINNTLFFEATDGNNPLDGVIIQIKNGRSTLARVETSGEGLATYELGEPSLDDEITFIASKEGYDNVELTKKVDGALLTITPPSISETIKIGDITGLSTMILLQNNTSKNVRISSAQINGDLKSYIDAKFTDGITGAIIDQGKDKNFTLSFKLNSNTTKLTSPKDLTGTIVINTEIPGAGSGYINEIPIAIRLSMPGFIDDAKCLKVSPATLDFITSDTEESKTITVSNLCTAEDTQIPLHTISAKLNETMKIGTISISGAGFSTTALSDKYTKISDTLEKDSETELTIRFLPNLAVPSGKQTVTLSLIGKNILDDKTEEKVEATVKVNSTMNSLAKCVEIQKPDGGILLDIAPWNLGYSRLMGSNMSAYAGGYQGFTNRSAPYNMQYMGGMGMMGYGTSGYGAGYGNGLNSMGNYPGSIAGGGMQNMSYQQNSFIIKNNCQTDIDVDLDPDSRVTISTDKFTLSKDSDETILVDPGYVLGKYKIRINAKPTGTTTSMKNLGDVPVTIRRLGDVDTDCIKTNVTTINLNSFIYKPQKYTAYNYCYDSGVQLSRSNIASIECSAPQNNLGLNYFQQGAEGAYAQQFPLNGQNQVYNNYIQQNGCQANSCSLITGIRVRQRTTEQGNNGTIEQVDFDVMPSAQYIPQQKLFDNKVGKYGLFQNLSDIRQWATETDARTNVYGNLNISYTNQYGSAECMEFPITITDIWRVGESIDSAVNWGDPTARPKDCQEPNALNITEFWKNKGGKTYTTNKDGVVPDSGDGFNAEGRYIYIAEPPALRIGPSPTQSSSIYPAGYGNNMYAYMNPQYAQAQQGPQYYSSGNQSFMKAQASTSASSGASKNCGLLDEIDVKTIIDPKEVGGAKITITDRGTGSLLTNSRGSNLMVEIDRSEMTVNCVHLQKPITAKVSRSINFDSQELTWILDVKFAKKGIPYVEAECMKTTASAVIDCRDALRSILIKNKVALNNATDIQKAIDELIKDKPECKSYANVTVANEILAQLAQDASLGKGCAIAQEQFAGNLITKTNSTPSEIVDCTRYFCNGEMLNLFLLKKFSEARTLLTTELSDLKSPLELDKKSKVAKYDSAKDVMVSRLYRRAIEKDINLCASGAKAFYGIEGTKALDIYGEYSLKTLNIDAGQKKVITDKIAGAVPLVNMVEYVLKSNDLKKDFNSLLIKVAAKTDMNAGLEGIGFVLSGTDYYLSLATYSDMLTQVANNVSSNGDCDKANTSCKINLCGKANVVLEPKVIQYIADKAQLVKGVYDSEDMNQVDIEAVYSKNPKLNKMHDLAKFSSNLADLTLNGTKLNSGLQPSVLLAKTTLPADGFAPGIISGLTGELGELKIEYSGVNDAQIGRYSIELDYAYVGSNVSKEAKATLADYNSTITGAPKVQNNALLQSGFNETTDVAVNTVDAILLSPTRSTLLAKSTITGKMTFYKKVPVKVSAKLYAGESGLMYRLLAGSTTIPSLINWYVSENAPKGPDSLVTGNDGMWYNIRVTPSDQVQNIYGIYYYPEGGSLLVNRGVRGGEITLTKAAYKLAVPLNAPMFTIPGANSQPAQLFANAGASTMTLNDLLPELAEGKACYGDDSTISWNESKLIKGN